MIDLRPLIQPAFWLNTNPLALSLASQRLLFIAFAAFLILGAIVRMVAVRRKEDKHVTEVFNRAGRLGVTMGLIGLIIFFFSFEQIPFFGARFWYLFWGLGFLSWTAAIVRYVIRVVPRERSAEVARQEREKYLPKAHA